MPPAPANVAVLGSTGSIGRATLEVIAAAPERWRVVALSAHRNLELLVQQARQFRPRWVIASDDSTADDAPWHDLPPGTTQLTGEEGLIAAAVDPSVDIVVAAIVGSAGLRSTWAAIESGKRVALANKETLVVAGPLVMDLARRSGATVIPVDSEHSAVFQVLSPLWEMTRLWEANPFADRRGAGVSSAQGFGSPDQSSHNVAPPLRQVERVVLTASGGPFRNHSAEELMHVTVDDALAHPTWTMGRKITIDSATLMNKALEIIEARWLFGLRAEQIGAVIHPQSVVHALVEFVDGSVIAQLSPPDMRLPIQYALSYPERFPSIARRLDWSQAQTLTFDPPDFSRFPALRLGMEVAAAGGTAGAVLSAANEAAVAAFLAGELQFSEVVSAVREVLAAHEFDPSPTLDRLFQLDRWAREEVARWVCTS